MTQLVLKVTPYPKRKRVSSSKPHYDITLGIKRQDIVCIKNPIANLSCLQKSKLSTEPQLLTLQKYVEKQVQRRIIVSKYPPQHLTSGHHDQIVL